PLIFLDLVIVDDGSAALDETKLTGGGRNELRRTLGQEAAVRTRLAADTQRAALRALDELALVTALPLRMLGRSRSQIGAERPRDAVLGQAVLEDSAAVIEDDDVGLAHGRPQPAADHLAVEAHLFRRTRENDAAYVGQIEALGEYHAIADNLGLAGGQSAKDRRALVDWCRAIEVFGAHVGFDELVADVDTVAHAAGEGDSLAALAILEPMRDDVADELGLIHALGQLGLDIVAR